MVADDAVRRLMDAYPRIFFACHVRHVRDPETDKLLSAHQASVLDHLDAIEPMSLTSLAEHMGVTPSTMSLAIDRLERRGYVRRRRDAKDARRIQLRLTAAGVRVREAKSVLDPDRVGALLACLTPEEREKGLHGLALLAKAAGESMRRLAARNKGKKRRSV